MRKILVEVTQADIDDSRRLLEADDAERALCCPIALAIRRATGKAAEVGEASAEFGGGSAELPARAVGFIARFDSGGRAKPFAFALDVPEEVLS